MILVNLACQAEYGYTNWIGAAGGEWELRKRDGSPSTVMGRLVAHDVIFEFDVAPRHSKYYVILALLCASTDQEGSPAEMRHTLQFTRGCTGLKMGLQWAISAFQML